MAISSIHISAAKVNFLAHNTRHTKTSNSIFKDEPNYYSNKFQDAMKMYRSELEIRSASYSKRTGQKIQAKTIKLLSAIVNLNQCHNEADLKVLCEHLEKTFDTKVVNFSIHRDEGHITEDGEVIKNYHAHVTFMGLDSQGNSVRKKLDRKALSTLQSKTAELLKMERGKNYIKGGLKRPKRLDTYEYKAHKVAETKLVNKTMKDLKAQFKLERAELKAQGATRADYAELEAEHKKLKEEFYVQKDLTNGVKDDLEYADKTMCTLGDVLECDPFEDDIKTSVIALKNHTDELKSKNKALLEENLKLSNKNASGAIIGDLKTYVTKTLDLAETPKNKTIGSLFKDVVDTLKSAWNEIKQLKNEILGLKKEVVDLREQLADDRPSSRPRSR